MEPLSTQHGGLHLRRLGSESEYAMYILYAAIALLIVACCVNVTWYAHRRRRVERRLQEDNVHNNMLRQELVDSFVDPEWQCHVCYNFNHPYQQQCTMCGTLLSGPSSVRGDSLSEGFGVTNASFEKDSVRKSKPQSRKLNTKNLTMRQQAARRRNAWQRKKFGDEWRWVRVDVDAIPVRQHTGAVAPPSTRSDEKKSILQMIANRFQTTRQPLPSKKATANTPVGYDSFYLSRDMALESSRHSTDSIGYVRDVDIDGNVTFIPADAASADVPRVSGIEDDLEAIASLPYKQKVLWFLRKVNEKSAQTDSHVAFVVRRQYLLADSVTQLMELPNVLMWERLRVLFSGEPALDEGGPTREWFQIICETIFDEKFGLFVRVHQEVASYWINPSSGSSHDDHLQLFRFVGRLLGKALMEGQTIPANLSIPLLKYLNNVPISFTDLYFFDSQIYKTLSYIKESTGVDSLYLTFSVDRPLPNGEVKTIDLKPNGREIFLADDNKTEYLDLMMKHYLLHSVSDQIEALVSSFQETLPRALISVFDYQELDLLLCGIPEIDVDDWERHTDLWFIRFDSPSDAELQVVKWFWEVVRGLSTYERARLLQFVTGSGRVPVQGFKALMSNDGKVRRFNIQLARPNELRSGLFPCAHTCFNRVDLPLYSSKEELQTYLLMVVRMEVTGFDIE